MTRTALLVCVVALVLSPAVAAHGDGGALGFTSTVTAIVPPGEGLEARVLQFDDRLELVNGTERKVEILGYEGEPYLEFRDGQVFRNALSPATFLNEDRFGEVDIPAEVDSNAPPRWEVVAPRERYDWHDHRIHWMSRELPPRIAATRDQAQHVFDWTIPGALDGEPLAIKGSLDYSPPPKGNPVRLMVGFGVALVLVGAIAVVLNLGRRREPR